VGRRNTRALDVAVEAALEIFRLALNVSAGSTTFVRRFRTFLSHYERMCLSCDRYAD